MKISLDMLLRHRIQQSIGVKFSTPSEIETHFGVKKAIRSAIETQDSITEKALGGVDFVIFQKSRHILG